MSEYKAREGRQDPLIDEVRAVRKAISDRFQGDVDRLCDYLAEVEASHRDRVVRASRRAAGGPEQGDT